MLHMQGVGPPIVLINVVVPYFFL